MFYSSFDCKDSFKEFPAAIQKALEWLKSHDLEAMEPGKYEIDGKKMYVAISAPTTQPVEERKPEAHEKYIDVQYLISGEETIGFVTLNDSYKPTDRNEEKDLIHYAGADMKDEAFVHEKPGHFSVFFPSDIHRPQCATHEPMAIKKAVVKVSIDLI